MEEMEQVDVMFPVPVAGWEGDPTRPNCWWAVPQRLPGHGGLALIHVAKGWRRGNVRVFPEGEVVEMDYGPSDHGDCQTCIVTVRRPSKG